MRPVVKLVAGLVALGAASAAAGLVMLAVVPSVAMGWDTSVLTSGSMTPALRTGDVVAAKPYRGEPLHLGSIVVFRDPEGRRVTHRIVATNDNGTFVTQGDANQVSDSTPLSPDHILGVGRFVVPRVGIPIIWVRTGRWLEFAALVVALALLTNACRWASRRDERDRDEQQPEQQPEQRTRRTRWGFAAAILVAVVATVAVWGPSPARGALTDTTGNGASQLGAGTWRYFLKSIGAPGAATQSSSLLPVGTSTPSWAGAVPNYDGDRDSDPGITLTKSQVGLAETNPDKYQAWATGPLSSSLTLGASTKVRLWSAIRQFHPNKAGSVSVGLYDCSATSCTPLANGSANLTASDSWSGGSATWVEKTWPFPNVNHTIAAGRSLLIKAVVETSAGDGMMFAFDSAATPSKIEF
jgi:signal peptidase I